MGRLGSCLKTTRRRWMCKVNLSIGHKVGEIGMGVLWDS